VMLAQGQGEWLNQNKKYETGLEIQAGLILEPYKAPWWTSSLTSLANDVI